MSKKREAVQDEAGAARAVPASSCAGQCEELEGFGVNVSACGSYEVGDVGDHEGRSANVVVGLGVDARGVQVVGDATVEGFGCFLAAHAADDAREGSVQTCCRVLARGGQSEEEDVVCS